MTTFRISITATLIVASVICTALALTKTQQAASKKCLDAQADCYNHCYIDYSLADRRKACEDRCDDAWRACRKKAGIPTTRGDLPPPPKVPSPPPVKSPTPPPSKRPPGPPPGKIKSSPTAAPTVPTTIYSKPSSPSPTPRKDQQPKNKG